MNIKIKGKEDFRWPIFCFNSYRNITFLKDVELSQVGIICCTAAWHLHVPKLKSTVVGYLRPKFREIQSCYSKLDVTKHKCIYPYGWVGWECGAQRIWYSQSLIFFWKRERDKERNLRRNGIRADRTDSHKWSERYFMFRVGMKRSCFLGFLCLPLFFFYEWLTEGWIRENGEN